MNWFQNVGFLIIYTLVYVFLVFATLAEGKGSFIFASLLLPWLFFLVATLLIAYVKSKTGVILIFLSIGLYYVISTFIVVVEQSGDGNFERTIWLLNHNQSLFIFAVIWYVLGQCIFWFLVFWRIRQIRQFP